MPCSAHCVVEWMEMLFGRLHFVRPGFALRCGLLLFFCQVLWHRTFSCHCVADMPLPYPCDPKDRPCPLQQSLAKPLGPANLECVVLAENVLAA